MLHPGKTALTCRHGRRECERDEECWRQGACPKEQDAQQGNQVLWEKGNTAARGTSRPQPGQAQEWLMVMTRVCDGNHVKELQAICCFMFWSPLKV